MPTFDLHGLAVETRSALAVDPGAVLLAAFPPAAGGEPPRLRIEVEGDRASHDAALRQAQGERQPPPVLVHGDIRVHEDEAGTVVLGPRASVRVDAAGSRITASVRPGPGLDLRSLVDLELRIALVLALRPHGLVHLHAAAAVLPDGRPLLIAGTGGVGKSTLVSALVASGSSYLGDDAVFLDPDGGIRAFPRPFHLSPDAARAVSVTASGPVVGSGKREVDPLAAFPGRLCWRCGAPVAVLLPQIEDAPRSTVEPLPRAQALAVLLAVSSFAASRLPGAEEQRQRLARLVDGAETCRVRLGRDLLEDAAATAGRIAARL